MGTLHAEMAAGAGSGWREGFPRQEFYQFKNDFAWFDEKGEPDWNRHGQFRDKLADIILDHAQELIAFTSMVPIKDRGTRSAHTDAALRALYDATKFRMRGKDSLYVVLARHPELSPWSILKWFEQIDWEDKLAGCGIFRPDDVLPLQAADFVLSSLNRAWGASKPRRSDAYRKDAESETSHSVSRSGLPPIWRSFRPH